MQKTIVVEVTRKKAHPMYGRVISIRKKFYAHDEKNETHAGDVVKIEESRPLSKLKRWTLKEIVRKTALVPEVDIDAGWAFLNAKLIAKKADSIVAKEKETNMALMMRSMIEVADNSGAASCR